VPQHVILLRGVNVGKAKRVPMAQFKDVLLDLGCTQAVTLLNSGNAIVAHPKALSANLAQEIAKALELRFGFAVPVVAHSQTEFGTVVSGNTLRVAEQDHARLLVAFSQSPATIAALESLSSLVTPDEQWVLGSHAAYLLCATGILKSKAAAALLGKLGQQVTVRNWATVLKLQTLMKVSRP
jgi:uncharacterized protein (DUF1697 family)